VIKGKTLELTEPARRAGGRVVSYVPQDSGGALNPALRVVDSINDLIRAHRGTIAASMSPPDLLAAVGLPESREFSRRYPHQLSGGQQQRVCVAMSLACEPAVVVLDEPTTGLDVVTQARILTELLRLKDEHDVAMLYVTHDLAVVAQIADRIAVMYSGRIVEQGRGDEVLQHPKHPYTRGLLASIPDHRQPRVLEPMAGITAAVGQRPPGCSFAPRCPQRVQDCELQMPPLEEISTGHDVRCFEWRRTPPLRTVPLEFIEHREAHSEIPVLRVDRLCAEHRSRQETVIAARDVSFDVPAGACVALVGESGSGKTTIARAIAGLHEITSGTIALDGETLAGRARQRSTEQRRRLQIVFQNPAEALNPRLTVRTIVARPAQILRGLARRDVDAEVRRLLEQVRLPAHVADRYSTELSGGERQRVAIARALAAEPEIILCDEITSALDVSVQAAVLTLLADLRRDLGLSLLFITHDLGVVAALADDVLVLESGTVCERGATGIVLRSPQHPYTQRLLEAAPSVAAVLEEESEPHVGTSAPDPSVALERSGDCDFLPSPNSTTS
jgi:peptide/nickel transport system ATP-binding protein